MESGIPSPRAHVLRPALLVVLGLVVLGVAAGLVLRTRPAGEPEAGSTPQQAAAPSTTAPQPAPGTAATPQPTFDIVRINPQGDAVMAGRAAPGSKVIVSGDGKIIGDAQADQNGDWVFVPSAPLAPGARTLTLTERMPDGSETKGDRSVVLVVPATGAAGNAAVAQTTPPLAVLTGPNAAPAVLTGPPAADDSAGSARLGLNAAEYGENGKIRLSGTATPDSTVRVYLDDKPVGTAAAGRDGQWHLSANDTVSPGEHKVRVDQIGANGAVATRVERAFSRGQMLLAGGKITINPGQNLWTIARRTYGSGISYLVIFQANRHQIRDPNKIYPGQVFAVPSITAAPAMPASSSTSR